MTPEQSALLGDKVLRITYHRRMYGLGEVGAGLSSVIILMMDHISDARGMFAY